MTPAQPESNRPRLVLINTGFQGRQYVLSGPAARIGRSRECEIQLDLGSISRQHAVVEERGGRFFVRDLGSRNGIRVGDRAVMQAELHNGDVITVGEALLRFRSRAPAGADTQAAGTVVTSASPAAPATGTSSSSARLLTVSDLVAASSVGPAADTRQAPGPASEAAPAPTVGLNVKLVAAVLIALVLSVAGGSIILVRKGKGPSSRAVDLGPVLLQVGGNKWLGWSQKYGDFSYEDIRIEDETVADARRYGPCEVVIEGKAGGATTIEITTNKGRRMSTRVLVRGRIEDPLEKLTYGEFSGHDERRLVARGFIERGKLLEKWNPYLALQEFRQAEAVLKPILENDKLCNEVDDLIESASNAVEKRWAELTADIRVALKNNALTRAQELLDEALDLIPDPNDPRHQKVAAKKQQLIDNALRMKEKKKRRGR